MRIDIWTDGACRGNPGPGGWCAILVPEEGERCVLEGGARLTTNNRMELSSVIVALEKVQTDFSQEKDWIWIYTDSKYVSDSFNKGWLAGWKNKGWLAPGCTRLKNVDLWLRLAPLAEALNVRFVWVKGHAGHPVNEECDRRAVAVSYRSDLPPDEGYGG